MSDPVGHPHRRRSDRPYQFSAQDVVLLVAGCTVFGAAVATLVLDGAGALDAHVRPDVSVTIPQEPTVTASETGNTTPSRSSRPSTTGNTNYIQAPHTRIGYYWVNDHLRVAGVDTALRVQGKSMQPAIFTDNVILAETYHGQPLREGMIIGYSTGNGQVVHRIQGEYLDRVNGTLTGFVYTRGDNNDGDGDRVYPHQIEYIVKGVLFD